MPIKPSAQASSPWHHENHLLAGLPPSDAAMLAPHLHLVSFDPGAVLHRQDEPLEQAYFPHDGLVSLLTTAPGGYAVEVASIARGGVVCAVLDWERPESFLTAVAGVTTRASRIPVAQLLAVRSRSEAFRIALRGCCDSVLLQARRNLACAGLHPAERRLARWLLEAADRLETHILPIPMSQKDVAHRLGVGRTTVTLLSTNLQRAGAIRWGRSRVEILDRTSLETMACSCYAALSHRTQLASDSAAAPQRNEG